MELVGLQIDVRRNDSGERLDGAFWTLVKELWQLVEALVEQAVFLQSGCGHDDVRRISQRNQSRKRARQTSRTTDKKEGTSWIGERSVFEKGESVYLK